MIFQEAALNIVVTIMMMAGLPVEDQELQADIYCGAQNIYFEAGSEPFEGMMAIADVTINRKKDTRWPDSICNVVWQNKQFSWTIYPQWYFLCGNPFCNGTSRLLQGYKRI